jgi:hypothetical protein
MLMRSTITGEQDPLRLRQHSGRLIENPRGHVEFDVRFRRDGARLPNDPLAKFLAVFFHDAGSLSEDRGARLIRHRDPLLLRFGSRPRRRRHILCYRQSDARQAFACRFFDNLRRTTGGFIPRSRECFAGPVSFVQKSFLSCGHVTFQCHRNHIEPARV